MVGKSGIGKSETALDLVVRGHRLVADDVIVDPRASGSQLSGRGAGILGHHMEIRGLGIINIKDLFGISAVREAQEDRARRRAARVGRRRGVRPARLRRRTSSSCSTSRCRSCCVPVRPGRNLATLIEVAARNQLLKVQGTTRRASSASSSTARSPSRPEACRATGRGRVADADRDRHGAVGRGQEHRAARARGHRVHVRRQHPGAAGRRSWSITSRTRATATSSRSRSTRASAATSPAWRDDARASCAAPATASR